MAGRHWVKCMTNLAYAKLVPLTRVLSLSPEFLPSAIGEMAVKKDLNSYSCSGVRCDDQGE